VSPIPLDSLDVVVTMRGISVVPTIQPSLVGW
jgi:hypothetical protein